MRILVVFGTRPELIKLAPVVLELRRRPARFSTRLLATAQHRDILDQMLGVFGLRPDIDLDLMRPGQPLDELTARVLAGVTDVLRRETPDGVLVQGDTTTAMASALAAFYLGIPVGHVEAGLRTGDPTNPFPEELNRRIITLAAAAHFAPTRRAAAMLRREGVPAARILITGNTVVDALHHLKKKLGPVRRPPYLAARSRLILVTAHRRESFGAPLAEAFGAMAEIVRRFEDVEIVYPVHPNPNVRSAAEYLKGRERIHLIEPVDYFEFLNLMRLATLILTDSGGIQEEAPAFRKPVLVMRKTTERPEGLRAGIARLVGTDFRTIVRAASRLLADPAALGRMARGPNPYGDGRAARRIAAALAAGIRQKPSRTGRSDRG